MSFHFDLGCYRYKGIGQFEIDFLDSMNTYVGMYSTDHELIGYLLTISPSIWAGRAHYGGGATPEIGQQTHFYRGRRDDSAADKRLII